jgi:hypothetical protein
VQALFVCSDVIIPFVVCNMVNVFQSRMMSISKNLPVDLLAVEAEVPD